MKKLNKIHIDKQHLIFKSKNPIIFFDIILNDSFKNKLKSYLLKFVNFLICANINHNIYSDSPSKLSNRTDYIFNFYDNVNKYGFDKTIDLLTDLCILFIQKYLLIYLYRSHINKLYTIPFEFIKNNYIFNICKKYFSHNFTEIIITNFFNNKINNFINNFFDNNIDVYFIDNIINFNFVYDELYVINNDYIYCENFLNYINYILYNTIFIHVFSFDFLLNIYSFKYENYFIKIILSCLIHTYDIII